MTIRPSPILVLGTLLLVQPIRAETSQREKYERELIDASLESLGLVADPEPAGKTIEAVIVIRHPIVEANDPWPYFLNMFHVVTREHIVRQELLFDKGQVLDEELVRESARNLRALPLLFSTVRIITARGTTPDLIQVVVITKDLWSIRINSNFNLGGGVFNFVSFMPSEMNFLGFNQQVSLYTLINPDTLSLGQIYRVPRLFGTRLTVFEFAGLRVNHQSGDLEGGFGDFAFGLPLYSVTSKWGFSLSTAFDIGTDRRYREGEIEKVWVPDGTDLWPIDRVYKHRSVNFTASGVRSFGQRWKTNLLFGYQLRSAVYDVRDDFPGVPDTVRQAFLDNVVPLDDQAGELFFNVNFFEASYHRFMNIQTYGLTEDFRFGPSASFEVAWANPAFGFAQQSLKFRLQLGYRFLFAGNILSLTGAVSTRWRPHHVLTETDSEWVDRSGEILIENVTPELFGLGKLFLRVHYGYVQYSASRAEWVLGGDNTLRGFPTNSFVGPRLLNFNVEFRSRPWEFKTLHIGFVLFYDGGDAYGFTEKTDFRYHQSVGFGIRGLFPQFDRGTMRMDIGIPLGDDANSDILSWVTLAYLQAF